MPISPDATTLGLWIIGASTVVGAALVLWRFAAALLAAARRVGHFLDDWFGEEPRPGAPGRPGMPERIANVEAQVADVRQRVEVIEHEFHPNAGSSLRDAVDRVDVRTRHIPPMAQQLAADDGGEGGDD